ncbi:hypothetical protein [Natrononativus amylolyticus]|uniref:hypothetical protein n=1 Tax=Natrononativus amylolyticus TaxID=2963434 RepID=UPI0020CE7E0A|nr:hypothetical protein [Natrononativus amylolyticus]
MPEKEQQEKTLSERLVKEAVEKGMDSPMREQILEAVEESEGAEQESKPTLPLVGALVGLGAAAGYLVGRQQGDAEETPLEDVDEPEIIEEFTGDESETEADDAEAEAADAEAEADDSGRRLPRLVLALSALAGIALLRRRLKSDDEEEWEPIEEFEPAIDTAETDDEGDEGDENEVEGEEDELENDVEE